MKVLFPRPTSKEKEGRTGRNKFILLDRRIIDRNPYSLNFFKKDKDIVLYHEELKRESPFGNSRTRKKKAMNSCRPYGLNEPSSVVAIGGGLPVASDGSRASK